MYEKHGLMSKITNPVILEYMRNNRNETHTGMVERALRMKLNIPEPDSTKGNAGKKEHYLSDSTPVKVTDPMLVDYIVTQRKVHGVSHRHTIESAILAMIAGEAK